MSIFHRMLIVLPRTTDFYASISVFTLPNYYHNRSNLLWAKQFGPKKTKKCYKPRNRVAKEKPE